MEEYIVSARKYRPLNFDSVVGQRALTTTLKNAIASGKLAHAFLFCGPRGVGKTTCARIFAKAINCLSPRDGGDACGECESCLAFDQQRSMNIHELDAASNNSVEDIRELCKQVQIPPQIGKYKVFIIDEVHMLSSAAFNAFLKTLEEPPSYVIFILATTEKHKILPTILSRCQVFDFQRMTIQNTVEHLMYVAEKEGYTATPEALNLIAQKADGGMRDALSIFDQMVSFTNGQLTYENVCKSLNVLSTEYYFKLVDHFLKNEVEPCLLLLNEILQKGFDGGNFISGLATHLRDLLVSRDAVTLPLLEMSEQMRARYQEQAMRCQPRFLYKAIKLCNDCDQAYRTSRNKRLQVEICLIQAAQLTEEDVPSAGLGPAKTLKPIFNKLEQTNNTAASEPTTVAKSAIVAPKVAPAKTAEPVTTPEKHEIKSAVPEKKPTLMKVSFKHFGSSHNKAEEEAQNQQQVQQQENIVTPLEESAVRISWREYINEMQKTDVVTAQRLLSIQPLITGTSSLQLNISNQQLMSICEELKPAMTKALSQRLKNTELEILLKLEDAKVVHRATSKTEQLKRLCEENHPLKQLVEDLGLEFA